MSLINREDLIAEYDRVHVGAPGGARKLMVDAPEVQPEPQWIPVSDPPDTDRNVFIARGERDCMSVCIGHYSNEYKQWYEDRNWFGMLLYDGLYWCEIPKLPEPYREEGGE